jgi:hypothetical protein
MSENKTKKKRKLKLGRPPKHGGFSYLVKSELPENRKYIRRYLTNVRESLIRDLGPTEEDLSAAQIILIDRVVTKLGVIRCIEEYIRENTVMEGDRLAPSLRESYLHYNESIRRDLMALGIQRKESESFDLAEYVRKKYPKKEESDGK